MKTQNVTPVSFSGIKFVPSHGYSEKVVKAIENSSAITRMSKFYNAKIQPQYFLELDKTEALGLVFYDIKPKNLLSRIYGLFKNLNITKHNFCMFNSHEASEEGLIKVFDSLDSDTFISRFKRND